MVIAAVGTVLAAGYLLWLSSAPPSARRREEFADEHIHDVHVTEWIAWTAAARAHPGARHLPEPHLPRHRPGPDAPWATTFAALGVADRARLAPPVDAAFDRPVIDFHALAPEIVLTGAIVAVLLVDLFTPEGSRGIVPQVAGIGLLAVADPGAHPGRRRRRPVDVRRRLRRRQLRPRAQGAVPAGRLRRGAAVHELHRRGRLRRGRVLLPAAVVAPRHDGDGVVARPHHDLRGPRAAVDPRLHAGRLAQARPPRQRGRREVLPDGRVRLGRDALRHVAALRLHRQHARSPTSARSIGGRRHHAVHHPRHRARRGRLRLQGVGRAVPHLGPRHLRGRAHADHRLPRGGLEGGRLRGAARS